MTKRQVIGVLGCHRSGTSALTRGMRVLSAVIGDDLLPPVENNNPTGFWEDRGLHLLLQDMQRSAGSDWDELSYGFVATHRYVQQAAKEQILEFFDSRASQEYPFVFKNPRATLILPLLHEVFDELDVAASYVIAVRDPLSTARSLHRRDGLPLELGALLWLKYITQAVVNTSNSNRVFVRYDNYLQNPGGELRRIELALDVPQLALRPTELQRIEEDFLRPDLRHSVHTSQELSSHPAIPASAVAAFESLAEASQSDAKNARQVDNDLWQSLEDDQATHHSEWLMIDEARRTATTQAADLSQMREELEQIEKVTEATLQDMRDTHATEAARLEREADRLTVALGANSQALETSRAILEDRITGIESEAESRVREAEAGSAVENLELKDEVRGLTGQLDELETVAARLLMERDAARAKAARGGSKNGWPATAQAAALQKELDSLRSSTSWRLTRPLRSVGDVAKARRRRR